MEFGPNDLELEITAESNLQDWALANKNKLENSNFIYVVNNKAPDCKHFCFHFTFSDTCYSNGEASRGKKNDSGCILFRPIRTCTDGVAIFPAGSNPGDPGGKSLRGCF